MEIHIPNLFKEGQRVVVAKRVPEAKAWHLDWGANCDNMLGRVVVIMTVQPLWGYYCSFKEKPKSFAGWLPSPALQALSDDDAVIEIPGV
jgi:hypothetical protein